MGQFEHDHMSLLEILHFPDPRLRQKASPEAFVDGEIRAIVDNMFETMYSAPGIGLAAVHVNILKHIIFIDTTEDKKQPLCLINPEILESHGEEKMEEGCLSVPGIYEKIKRASTINARFLDKEGKTVEREINGLLAVCIQHEMDHLEGKLFVDYLSEMKRNRIRKKLEKIRQQTL